MKAHLLMSFPGLRIIEFANDKQLIEQIIDMQNYTGSARRKEIIRREQTREDVYLSMLTCFKGMSLRRAKAVAEKYNNIHSLMIGLRESPDKVTFGVKEINSKIFQNMQSFFMVELEK